MGNRIRIIVDVKITIKHDFPVVQKPFSVPEQNPSPQNVYELIHFREQHPFFKGLYRLQLYAVPVWIMWMHKKKKEAVVNYHNFIEDCGSKPLDIQWQKIEINSLVFLNDLQDMFKNRWNEIPLCRPAVFLYLISHWEELRVTCNITDECKKLYPDWYISFCRRMGKHWFNRIRSEKDFHEHYKIMTDDFKECSYNWRLTPIRHSFGEVQRRKIWKRDGGSVWVQRS